jgi:amidase
MRGILTTRNVRSAARRQSTCRRDGKRASFVRFSSTNADKMRANDLCFRTATELAAMIRRREISACELMQAHVAQIERLNPRVNAIVTFHPERSLERARAADEKQARGEPLGVLHGLPTAHKDLVMTKGVRTTWGSPVYRDFVPDVDSLIVERQADAGAISVGKTNTPEFGAGSQTFNAVFGATLNPYDLSRTCGGSSGGAAVALACGMVPIADGSDLGGSLRNPASFCNVVGFRASVGRVPRYPTKLAWNTFSVEGAMARTVEDVALLMQAIAGPDARVPLALSEPGSHFAQPLARDFAGVRVAWAPTLGNVAPVDAGVAAAIDAQRPVFESLGCAAEEAMPDLADADEVFRVQRALIFAAQYASFYRTKRELLKDTVIWNIEYGLQLDAERIGAAELKRTQLFDRVHRFFTKYDFLVLPVSQVPPFPVEQHWVSEIAGVPMSDYLEWMKSCYLITATGHPAISVPCGFTPEGLPVGMQIVGRYRGDFGVLQLAHAFEQATRFWKKAPPLAD